MIPLLEVDGLRVEFPQRRTLAELAGGRERRALRAVDGVSLSVERGEALGVVGESGCGKSSLALMITGLLQPTGGTIRFEGRDLLVDRNRGLRRRIQMIFQDPASSLNPSMTVEAMLSELLGVHRVVPREQVHARSVQLMEFVELPHAVLSTYPRTLSGGQRQRVAIARALAVEPELLIADEAVAALDVSVQASVLNLLLDLRERLDLTLIFISHDLAVVRSVCDRIAIMYLGRLVEEGATEDIFTNARHPYTQGLLEAAPKLFGRARRQTIAVKGEPPSPLDLPSGCRFHPRCPLAQDVCRAQEPVLLGPEGDNVQNRHRAACHFAWTEPPATVAREEHVLSSS